MYTSICNADHWLSTKNQVPGTPRSLNEAKGVKVFVPLFLKSLFEEEAAWWWFEAVSPGRSEHLTRSPHQKTAG